MNTPTLSALLVCFSINLACSLSFAGTQDDAKIALHLKPHSSKSLGKCDPWDVPCSQFATNGTVGVPYDLYLIVANADPQYGIGGLSCGITYNDGIGQGADAFSWHFCGALEFPNWGADDPWPSSGSGTRVTWDVTEDCQRHVIPGYESEGVHTVAGVFYVYAYSNDVFAIIPNSVGGGPELAVADCGGTVSDLPLLHELAGRHWIAAAVHFDESGSSAGFNPCTGYSDPPPEPPDDDPPPPPPPPTPATDPQEAAFMLHVTDAENPRTVCGDGPISASEVITVAEARSDGTALYYVYVLGSPEVQEQPEWNDNMGLSGLRFGIEYDEGPDADVALGVFAWNGCGVAGFSSGDWPTSGTGQTLVWGDCQETEVVVGGYFYIAAYAPSTMSLVAFPSSGSVEYTSCSRAESEFIPTDMSRVGWVSLGGAAKGTDADGCNPMVEPCNQETTPVQRTTWGRLKAKYRSGS